MKRLNSEGVGALAVVAVVVLVGAVAATGWFVWNRSQDNNQSTETVVVEDAEAPEAEAEAVARAGTFAGVGDKTGSGGVSVIQNPDGVNVVALAQNFAVQAGPKLFVAFANDGQVETSTYIGALQSTSGSQTYVIPEDLDPTKYNQVMIWCEEFSTAFSIATLVQI